MRHQQIIILSTFLLITFGVRADKDSISDIGLNTKQLITKNGYPYESYVVQTDDGYLLTLQRIPHGRRNNTVGNRHPVFLMPGFIADASCYVCMGQKSSLAFVLADNGYDVWLGNYRGSTLSRKHVFLNPDVDKKKFWEYSFHEIGYYDAPAFIDRVLKVTEKADLFYIGHSQGTTAYLVMLSEKPKYSKKIRFGVLLAPASITTHLTSPPFVIWLRYQNVYKVYAEKYQAYEFARWSREIAKIGATMCSEDSTMRDICGDILLLIAGWTPKQLNRDRFPVITSNIPSGSSVFQIYHYFQLRAGIFQQYDHGTVENLKRYNQKFPPKYNLSNVAPPVGIYHGDIDYITDPRDVYFLASNLPNVVAKRLYKGFNHADVIWGNDAPQIIFKDILKDMKFYH